MDTIATLLLIVSFVFSVIVHEVAHGYVAYQLGDPTAYRAGRLTLNPLPHIDPFWTLLFPLLMYWSAGFAFGGAKPVPVNPWNFRNPRRGMMWTGLAGPASNIALAILATFTLFLVLLLKRWIGWGPDFYVQLFAQVIFINFILAGFNLIPIPPLDGSRVLAGLVSHETAEAIDRLEQYGILILIGLLILPDLGGPDLLSFYRIVARRATEGMIETAFSLAYAGGD